MTGGNMSGQKNYPIKPEFEKHAEINEAQYRCLYQESIERPENFWATQARAFLDWQTDFHQTFEFDFEQGKAQWFDGGKLNVAYNCIDRHLKERASQTAII